MLVIPNIQTITFGVNGFDGQAVQDATDTQALQMGADGAAAVLYGMNVTSTSGMDIAISSGVGYLNNKTVPRTQDAVVGISAASTTDRRDIICISASYDVVKGTPCGSAGWRRTSSTPPPVKPALPATSILIAEIYVVGTTTATYKTTEIAAKNIVQKSVPYGSPRGTSLTTQQTFDNATTTTAVTGLSMALVPTQRCAFDAQLYVSPSATGSTGISVAVNVPSGASLTYNILGCMNSTETRVVGMVTTNTTNGTFMTADGSGFINLDGVVSMSTATGALTIGVAFQTGSSSTKVGTATVYAGSNIVVVPL